MRTTFVGASASACTFTLSLAIACGSGPKVDRRRADAEETVAAPSSIQAITRAENSTPRAAQPVAAPEVEVERSPDVPPDPPAPAPDIVFDDPDFTAPVASAYVASSQFAASVDESALERRRLTFMGEEDELSPTEIHYIKSNEVRHDVWFSQLAGAEGVYVGVGADQNYTLIAASRVEVAFLLDIDQRVVDLHRIYEALIEASPTADALLRLFTEDARDEAMAIIDRYADKLDEDARTRLRQGYKAGRETLRRHLAHVHTRTAAEGPSTWLSNAEWYARIRAMFLADRVRPMAGDLTGSTTMQTIAANTTALGLKVGVLYLSNAEEYFRYSDQFRSNVRALPAAPSSLVFRTIYGDKWEHAARLWNYQIQPLVDFQQRLTRPETTSRNPMLRMAGREGAVTRDTGIKGRSHVGMPTEPHAAAPRRHAG